MSSHPLPSPSRRVRMLWVISAAQSKSRVDKETSALTFATGRAEGADSSGRQTKEGTSHANDVIHPQRIPGASHILEGRFWFAEVIWGNLWQKLKALSQLILQRQLKKRGSISTRYNFNFDTRSHHPAKPTPHKSPRLIAKPAQPGGHPMDFKIDLLYVIKLLKPAQHH